MLPSLQLSLRAFRRPTLASQRRLYATTPQADQGQGAQERHDQRDHRPPWVYRMSRLVTTLVIPSIAVYSVFFVDFGDRDHVFMPIRRWAARQKAAFFSLSPAEQRLVESHDTRLDEEHEASTTS